MIEWIKRLLRVGYYARDFGGTRSGQWPAVRAVHLKGEPVCRICGGNKSITVHHIEPFHLNPKLELDPTNLITLCEGAGNGNHHLIFGHWGNYRTKYNPNIQTESKIWLSRFIQEGDNSVADPD